MKLRNKKTGEIRELIVREDYAKLYDNSGVFYKMVGSLAEINAEWEDCIPKEPLIEDEKTRNIIRAWAEVCGVTKVEYYLFGDEEEFVAQREYGGDACISFNYPLKLEDNKTYTIHELCGEEE